MPPLSECAMLSFWVPFCVSVVCPCTRTTVATAQLLELCALEGYFVLPVGLAAFTLGFPVISVSSFVKTLLVVLLELLEIYGLI